MSSIYLVKCPHVGCDWFGILPCSAENECGGESAANVSLVVFQCPGCRQEWRARVIGDDVESLPLDDRNDELDLVTWPPQELGVGG